MPAAGRGEGRGQHGRGRKGKGRRETGRKVQTVVVEKEKIVEKEKEVTRVGRGSRKRPQVQITGTFQVIQKKDFFPSMNDWFRNEMHQLLQGAGLARWTSPTRPGYTGGTPFLEKLAASAAAGTPPT